jgi:hypothetical protein
MPLRFVPSKRNALRESNTGCISSNETLLSCCHVRLCFVLPSQTSFRFAIPDCAPFRQVRLHFVLSCQNSLDLHHVRRRKPHDARLVTEVKALPCIAFKWRQQLLGSPSKGSLPSFPACSPVFGHLLVVLSVFGCSAFRSVPTWYQVREQIIESKVSPEKSFVCWQRPEPAGRGPQGQTF